MSSPDSGVTKVSMLNKSGHTARRVGARMALRVAIVDDTFARRWLEGAFIRACIHNVTGEVVSIAVKGSSPTSGTAVFESHAALAALIKELQELENALQDSLAGRRGTTCCASTLSLSHSDSRLRMARFGRSPNPNQNLENRGNKGQVLNYRSRGRSAAGLSSCLSSARARPVWQTLPVCGRSYRGRAARPWRS